jgi:general secretion pathway protein M
MKKWFNQLNVRERYILIMGSLILGLILGYFLVWEPIIKARTQLEMIVTAQHKTLGWMQSASAEIQQLRRQSTVKPVQTRKHSLFSLIDQSTRQGVLAKANKRIEPKGNDSVRIHFEKVSFTELMRWLGRLHNQYQVQVNSIHIEPETTPDQVKVRLTLNY